MGQPIISYSKKGYISPYNNLNNEFENVVIPDTIGTFSPSQPKKSTYNSWAAAYKDVNLHDKNTTKHNRIGNKIVGKGEIGQTKGVSPDIDPTGIANVTKLRQMGFTPEQIITYTKLIRFNSENIQDVLKSEEEETHGEKPTIENVTETGYTAKIEQKDDEKPRSVSFAQTYKNHAMKIATRLKKTELDTKEIAQKEENTLKKLVEKDLISKAVPKVLRKERDRKISRFNTNGNSATLLSEVIEENTDNYAKRGVVLLATVNTTEIAPTLSETSPQENAFPVSKKEENTITKTLEDRQSPQTNVQKVALYGTKTEPSTAVNPFLKRIYSTHSIETSATDKISPSQIPLQEDIVEKIVTGEISQGKTRLDEDILPTENLKHETTKNIIEVVLEIENISEKESAVASVLNSLLVTREDSRSLSGPSSKSVHRKEDMSKTLENLAQKPTESWVDTIKNDEKILTLITDLKLSNFEEKDFITKYVPSYVDPNNPSSWASVSNFSVHEIIHGSEGIYGLTDQARSEISFLIKRHGTIDQATDISQEIKKYGNEGFSNYEEYILSNQKLTIHDYYNEVRSRIASAEKKEHN